MFKFWIILSLFLTLTLSLLNTTKTDDPYPSIICTLLSDPSIEDAGNYGDGTCRNGVHDNEKLIKRITLVTNNGETFLSGSYWFQNWTLTRVTLLNFGRHHGSAQEIGLINQGSTGVAQIYVNIFTGQGVRMFLEVYGVQL